jgi:hypothetical protein
VRPARFVATRPGSLLCSKRTDRASPMAARCTGRAWLEYVKTGSRDRACATSGTTTAAKSRSVEAHTKLLPGIGDELINRLDAKATGLLFGLAVTGLLSCASHSQFRNSHTEQLYLAHPAGSFHGKTITVSVWESPRDLRGFTKPVWSRTYMRGDWIFRDEWDLDGDGVFECREDECDGKAERLGLHRYTMCVSRLVKGAWRDEPPEVVDCVDPSLIRPAAAQ